MNYFTMFNRLDKFIIFGSESIFFVDKAKNIVEKLELYNIDIAKIISFADSSKIGIFLTNTIVDVFSISVKNENEIESEIEKYLGEEALDLVWDYKPIGSLGEHSYQVTAIKPDIVEIINDLTEKKLNIIFVEPISYVLLRKYKNNPALSLLIYSSEFQNSIILIENGAIKFDLPYESNHLDEQLSEVKEYLKKSNQGYMEPIYVNDDIFSDKNNKLRISAIVLSLVILIGGVIYTRSFNNVQVVTEIPSTTQDVVNSETQLTTESVTEVVQVETQQQDIPIDYQVYKLIILNGSGIPGEAAKTADIFKKAGFKDPDIGNYPAGTLSRTTIRTKPNIDSKVSDGISEILKEENPIFSQENLDSEGPYDIQIIVGEGITGE